MISKSIKEVILEILQKNKLMHNTSSNNLHDTTSKL